LPNSCGCWFPLEDKVLLTLRDRWLCYNFLSFHFRGGWLHLSLHRIWYYGVRVLLYELSVNFYFWSSCIDHLVLLTVLDHLRTFHGIWKWFLQWHSIDSPKIRKEKRFLRDLENLKECEVQQKVRFRIIFICKCLERTHYRSLRFDFPWLWSKILSFLRSL
jgi:hypothetical protein